MKTLSLKIAIALSALCFSSVVLAGIKTNEIKLLNANSPNKTLDITYKICDIENKNCSQEATVTVSGQSYKSISDLPDQRLHITKVIESVGNNVVAKGSNIGNAGAVFGYDSVLVFNDYNTDTVVYSFGW